MHNPTLKAEAIRLRSEERLSLLEIREQIPVSKSTLSLWLRGYPLTGEEKFSRRAANAHKNLHPFPKVVKNRESFRLSGEELVERRRLIRDLYLEGLGCRGIADRLGLKPPDVYRRLRRMGILRTHREASDQSIPKCPPVAFFSKTPSMTNLSKAATGAAAKWFLERGYIVSLPVEPTYYDLVVESDEGLKKVQVKTTTKCDKKSGCQSVFVGRTSYVSASDAHGTAGKRRKSSYTRDQVDLFFVMTLQGEIYLIPLEAPGSVKVLNLDVKYAKYRADVVKTW